MFFLMGLVDKETGLRRIMSGARHPTVRDMHDLTDGGSSAFQYDWGELASTEARVRTARLILLSITNRVTAYRLAEEYADTVVKHMETGRMWLIEQGEINQWVSQRVKVA